MNFDKLFNKAVKIIPSRKLSKYANCGGVSAALLTKEGKIYTGICIEVVCGLGFCAEHSAIAEMLKNGESQIVEILAIKESRGNATISPCGRCRELMLQINPENKNTIIHLPKKKTTTLDTLLPLHWLEK